MISTVAINRPAIASLVLDRCGAVARVSRLHSRLTGAVAASNRALVPRATAFEYPEMTRAFIALHDTLKYRSLNDRLAEV